jgi:hypothetical protein
MTETQSGKGRLISTLVVVCLLVATLVATVCLWLFVDRERYGFGLTLTLRILWGVWIVTLLAVFLTRVTIFGWSFRRYFRWQAEGPPPEQAPRPTRAPWTKGSKTSFSITVVLVSMTGAAAVTTAVLWVLEDVIGAWVFWLVSMIVWTSWWVGVIATVLTRVAIFDAQRQRAARQTEAPAAAGDVAEKPIPVKGANDES